MRLTGVQTWPLHWRDWFDLVRRSALYLIRFVCRIVESSVIHKSSRDDPATDRQPVISYRCSFFQSAVSSEPTGTLRLRAAQRPEPKTDPFELMQGASLRGCKSKKKPASPAPGPRRMPRAGSYELPTTLTLRRPQFTNAEVTASCVSPLWGEC
jgi:hypothetical protein